MISYRRHDISDKAWHLLEPHLPGREGVWGGIAKDNRLFINAVFWIIRPLPKAFFEHKKANLGFRGTHVYIGYA